MPTSPWDGSSSWQELGVWHIGHVAYDMLDHQIATMCASFVLRNTRFLAPRRATSMILWQSLQFIYQTKINDKHPQSPLTADSMLKIPVSKVFESTSSPLF